MMIPIRPVDFSAKPLTPLLAPLSAPFPTPLNHTGLTLLPPLSLYIHVPWCIRKCPYCDFNSHVADGDIPEQAYLTALQRDLEQALPLIWGRQIVSVFIGGGTPSLLSAAGVDTLLSLLRARLNLRPDIEITLEANPGTAEATRLRDYAASGVNRLSLGIQSFNNHHLSRLGRIHDADQARRAIALAQQAVSQVNLDIMFALPNQSLQESLADVREALSYGASHLSLYHLTLEPNTVFAKFPPPCLPDEDDAATMQEAVAALVAEAGFTRYEVSAYARGKKARCQHNVNYWEFGDYLGIGPGAHSKLSFHDRIMRVQRVRHPTQWQKAVMAEAGAQVTQSHLVAATELPFEFMLNVLRLKEGVPASYFTQRTGLSLASIAAPIKTAVQRGLLDPDPTRWVATPQGWAFLNDLQAIFLNG